MTYLFRDNEHQKAEMPQSQSWPQGSMSLIQDLSETFALVWEQTIRPALKALGYTVVSYWPTVCSAGLTLKNNMRVSQRKMSQTSPAFRKAYGLSLESAIALRRIQGNLGDDWALALNSAARVHQGKTNRWADAKRITRTAYSIFAPSIATTNMPASHEDILGLDDIFTGPVKGLFLEGHPPAAEYAFSPAAAQRQQSIQSEQAGDATHSNSNYPAPNHRMMNDTLSQQDKQPIRFDESLRARVRWPNDRQPRHEVPTVFTSFQADSEPETEENTKTEIVSEQPGLIEQETLVECLDSKNGNGAVSEIPTLEGLSELVNELIQKPVSSDQKIIPLETVKKQATLSTVEETSSVEDSLQGVQEDAQEDTPALTEELASLEPSIKTEAQQTVLNPSTETATTRQVVPEYRPLSEEENGADYIAQNNRILSRSITNLVDRYFQKAAEEEQSNFY